MKAEVEAGFAASSGAKSGYALYAAHRGAALEGVPKRREENYFKLAFSVFNSCSTVRKSRVVQFGVTIAVIPSQDGL